LIDKPGSLTKLTKIFKDLFANIVFIDYDRNSVKLDFGDANVTISVETKGEKHKQDILNKLEQSGFSYKEL
jgi:threonine dehydratase